LDSGGSIGNSNLNGLSNNINYGNNSNISGGNGNVTTLPNSNENSDTKYNNFSSNSHQVRSSLNKVSPMN